ncbi:outer membrane beta-barrel protein [Taibaiella koreensis]|uniref:outer membrane beta-barrel protein n=1 Tax=Taibaiella koreensis TaxID=1268548 RepID=UPI000E59B795|nr:outer membrane beta-barrel protein [Taibaiella koreensis]
MKRISILLLLLPINPALYAQSKWSAGYRLGLVGERTFSSSTEKNTGISNQVYAAYRILKHLEIEAGLQHNQVHDQASIEYEWIRAQPYSMYVQLKAQVINLSLAAKFHFLSGKRCSLYAFGGLNSGMAFGYYESARANQFGDILITRQHFTSKYHPVSALFAGLGLQYQIGRRVSLNTQAAGLGNTMNSITGESFPPYLYSPNFTAQVGFNYLF